MKRGTVYPFTFARMRRIDGHDYFFFFFSSLNVCCERPLWTRSLTVKESWASSLFQILKHLVAWLWTPNVNFRGLT